MAAKVSVVIPSYNHAQYLQLRLQSILDQTYKHWEAIIIDDKSVDNSVQLIETFIHKYPEFKVKHLIVNEENSGSGYTIWQKGIEMATTEYIWIAESDDLCSPNFLEECITALETHPQAVLAFTGSTMINKEGHTLYDTTNRFSSLDLIPDQVKLFSPDVFIQGMPLNPLITNASAVVFRKPANPFPRALFKYKQLSDLFVWTYLIQNKKFAIINNPLNKFRRHSSSTTIKNIKNDHSNLYVEYSEYLSYFGYNQEKSIAVIQHYFRHYLLPNRSELGYFNMQPLKNLPGVSSYQKLMVVVKMYIHQVRRKLNS